MRRYILGLEGSGTRMVARAIANKLARDGVAMSLNGVWDGERPPCWRRLIGAQSAVTPEGNNTKGVPFETVEHISLPWGLPCGSPILTIPFVDMCRPSTLPRRGRAGGGFLEPAPAQRPIELPPAHPDAHTPGVPINRRTVRFFANVTEILLRNPRSRAIVMTRESAFTIASTIQTRCQSFPKLAIKESHHAKRLVRHALAMRWLEAFTAAQVAALDAAAPARRPPAAPAAGVHDDRLPPCEKGDPYRHHYLAG